MWCSTHFFHCILGVLNFAKNGQGYENKFWFIWPLHCMVAPILHNKCSKYPTKGILNAFLHHPMWCSTHFPVLSQVRFLVVCLVLGQVLHPVWNPAIILVLHQIVFPPLFLVLIRVAHQVPSQVRFLVVCPVWAKSYTQFETKLFS